MKNSLPIFIVALIIVGAAAFFAGTKYQANQNRAGGNSQFRRVLGNGTNGAVERGQIIEVSDNSVTIKMADGSSKIILLSDKTTISQTTAGSKTDLKTGETVAVFGTSNSDGSITAQNVQLNPQFRGQ